MGKGESKSIDPSVLVDELLEMPLPERIKAVAVDLLRTLKVEKLRVDQWREKEATRDAVRLAIHDFLYSDQTGLPVDSYKDTEVRDRAEEVFHHVYRAYPSIPSPYYENALA